MESRPASRGLVVPAVEGETALGCLLLLGAVAGNLLRSEGPWWGVLVVPVALGIVAVMTTASPAEHRGKLGCVSVIAAVLVLGAVFPSLSSTDSGGSPPASPSPQFNGGSVEHEGACAGWAASISEATDPEIRAGLQAVYDEHCRS